MRISARAKINLSLEVLGCRSDGYHDLRSVVMPISLADDIELSPSDDVCLKVLTDSSTDASLDFSKIGPEKDNLAVKAADLLRLEAGRREGVSISITKRIPIGGGLGGGSADAAAVLVGLNEMWNLGLSRADLALIGARVGSDVPALALGGAVLMEGRGERVKRLFDENTDEIGVFDVILANPGVHSSTPEVFKMWQPSGLTKTASILHNIQSSVLAGKVNALAASLQNDLASAAYSRYPEIEQTARALQNAGAVGVSLSGSGATVFGLVRDAADGRKVQERMHGVWTALVRTCPVV